MYSSSDNSTCLYYVYFLSSIIYFEGIIFFYEATVVDFIAGEAYFFIPAEFEILD